jgi:uncharacterized protein YigE (DUF2233 family)
MSIFATIRRSWKVWFLFLLVAGPLLACGRLSSSTDPGIAPTTVTNTPAQQSSTLNTWYQASPGIEIRYEQWTSPGDNEDVVTIVRLDPHRIHLSVGYQPDQPMGIRDWIQQTHAKVVINGGYFDQQNHATGLVISNGQIAGTSYNGFGGMLSVDENGTIQLRSLRNQPYDPTEEHLQQATQSSPMLVIDGKRAQFSANAASQRRSIVAMDKQGRLLFIVSPNDAFSLDELADLLISSDLSIETALNLDGGASTGLAVNAGEQQFTVDSISALPIVMVVK